jgi:hypothetical protein
VIPIRQFAKTPSTATGRFAMLRGLLRVKGAGAPKIAPPESMNPCRLSLAVLVSLCVTAVLALWGVSAQAEVIHRYGSRIAEVPAEGVPLPGPVTGLNSMTVDSGHLWVAEKVEGTGNTRIDEFNASTGAFVSQLPQPSGLEEPVLNDGIAVGHATGEVYVGGKALVAGEPEGVVAVFDPTTGALLGTWTGTPGGAFGREGVQGVAVDNSVNLTDEARGDVYVADSTHGVGVVDVFRPETGGKEKYVTQITDTPTEPLGPARGVAVDEANGDVLVSTEAGLDVFEPTVLDGYVFVRQLTGVSGLGHAIAVDGANGEIYVSSANVVEQFSSTGVPLGRMTGVGTPVGQFDGVKSIAVDAVSHNVFVGISESEEIAEAAVVVFGGDEVIPDVATSAASNVKAESATLNGTVDALETETGEGATCRFAWGTSEALGATTGCKPPSVTGSSFEPVQEDLMGLRPDTTYYYRLQATNKNGTNTGEGSPVQKFTTSGPGVEEQSVIEVGSTSVTFKATINPDKAPTTYHFEYDTSEYNSPASHGTSLPIPNTAIGAGENNIEVTPLHVQGLLAGKTYHYRVVAVSELEGKLETFDSPDQTFTTWPAGGEFALPDGRAWELVSPPPGGNGATAPVSPIEEGSALVQAAEDGGAVTYGVLGSVEVTPPGASNFSQVLSVRGSDGGWSSREIATSREHASGVSIGKGQEYRYFSGDLSIGLVEPSVIEGLDAGNGGLLSPAASEGTLFLRADEPLSPGSLEQGPFSEAVAEGGYKALVTSKPGYANVPAGTKVAGSIEFEGASTGMSHVVLGSEVPLTVTTPEGKTTEGPGLYEWSAGRLELVSLLPNQEQAAARTLGNTNQKDRRGAVSSDGSRIVWTGSNSQGGPVQLYMRDVSREQTVQLDKNQGGPGGGPQFNPEFQFANSDGSKVFFTDEADLTAGSTAKYSNPDLYECEVGEVGAELECKLSDLTVDFNGHAGVRGVVNVGSNEDTTLYFVATGALTKIANERGENAKAGEDNLYMLRYDGETKNWESPVFIATLSSKDHPDWTGENGELVSVASRVAPDGRYLEFMSERSLTGYDNHDVNSGAADEEVFLYDADTNRLVCASCNPTGERPVGVRHTVGGSPSLIDAQNIWREHWLAANVPGWTGTSISVSQYQSRYLSDEGRLFFNSPSALVSQATNGLADVYEYEPVGVGSCKALSVTFSERSDGCVGLISSGSSSEESAFVDASENGDDVFFVSSAQLTSAATTGSALDVYDAHVCSALAPCSVASAPTPPCATEATCKAAPTPQPAIFGAGPSETFSGAGNPVGRESNQPPPAVKPKAKPAKCKRGFAKKKSRCVKRKGNGKAKKATRISYERRVGR